MILLSEHSLTRARKVPLEAMSLQLKERESTASMTPADMEGIGTGSWFLDDTEPGAGIVWRVQSIRTAWATDTPTVQLEHVINTLRDRILFGEVTPATITGSASAATCTARQAVEYILRHQSDWRLGSFDYGSVSNAYKFDGDTLFDALETVTGTLDDAWWSYDLTVYPFRLNITRKSSAVGSELRCGRNLRTIQRTIDTNGMYTRFYPIGYDDLHLASLYRERNTAAYGVIEHTETDTSRTTEAELASWANEKLNLHAEPLVNIEVEGLELVQATGESLDRLTLGRMCRVPLPEFGTTITERIVSLTYQDKVHQPEVVRITLANNRDDVVRIIADNMKSAGRGGRAATRLSKNDHAWFEDTDDHVAMCAEGIVGVDAEGNPNWILLSELIVDGTGIHQTVKSIQADQVLAWTAIEQNEESITLEAQRASEAEGELSGRITVAADAIELEVENRTNADEALSGKITVNAEAITAEVTRASDAEGVLDGKITVNADAITAEVTRATGAEGDLSGRITVNANAITAEVSARKSNFTELSGRLVVEAGKAGLVAELTDNRPIYYYASVDDFPTPGDPNLICLAVDTGNYYEWKNARYQSVDPGAVIKSGSIVTSINASNESEVHIDSDHVYVGSSSSTTVINGKLNASDVTAEYINGKIANIALMNVQSVSTNSATGQATFNSFYGNHYYIGKAGGGGSVTYTDMATGISDVQVDGPTNNVYKLQYKKFGDAAWSDAGTFSRATSLDGVWSGTGTLTVTASPQGETWVRSLSHSTPYQHTPGQGEQQDPDWYVKIQEMETGTPPTYTDTGHEINISNYMQQNQTFTANNTYSPGTGYYGFGDVVVDITPGLSHSWNNGTLTETESIKNGTDTVQLSHSSPTKIDGVYYIKVQEVGPGTPPSYIDTGHNIALPTAVSSLLQSRTVSATQASTTFYPTGDNIGLSSITVNVPLYSHSATLTRVFCSANSSGTRSSSGKLYYYDAASNSYKAASSSDAYWFKASVTIDTSSDGGTKTVYYTT